MGMEDTSQSTVPFSSTGSYMRVRHCNTQMLSSSAWSDMTNICHVLVSSFPPQG